jgi:hypothetical protein
METLEDVESLVVSSDTDGEDDEAWVEEDSVFVRKGVLKAQKDVLRTRWEQIRLILNSAVKSLDG